MKIVLFGAAGWLGRAALANLDQDHQVRAFEYSPEAWKSWEDIDGTWEGEKVHGDIADFDAVHKATEGMDAILHTAVYLSSKPGAYSAGDPLPFQVNLRGLWHVLESARQRNIRRIVHIGSCLAVHPKGTFFTAEVRSPEGGLYPITKRLQEEMCRQFHEIYDLPITVLRPDYIVDSRLGLGRFREKLGTADRPYYTGWVCRHDLAQACRLALELPEPSFDIFHIVGTPEAEKTCNVDRSREVLGLKYEGNLEQYR